MNWTDKIRDQLIEYISTPTVLVTKDDIPYEFKQNGSVNRLKRRRYNDEIPLQLYSFICHNDVSKSQMQEFASGLFLNYIDTTSIYS